MTGTGRGLILDRDGVINEDSGYLHGIEECRFVDGIFDLTAAFAARGFAIVIASNQSGIGRGFYTEADFERLMAWMTGEFARRGVAVAGVYHCPDHPTEGVGRYRRANQSELRNSIAPLSSEIPADRRFGCSTVML